MGHSGAADWTWAQRAREVVSIPVLVNGDVRTADDAKRALETTGCEGVMVGRRAIEHPWVFREAYGLLREGREVALPTAEERIDLCKAHLRANVAERASPTACAARAGTSRGTSTGSTAPRSSGRR